MDAGSPRPALEEQRPAELVAKSFSLDDGVMLAIEDATVDWSTGETLVDKSQVVRALLDSAARESVTAPHEAS